jgi:hypothetical protein
MLPIGPPVSLQQLSPEAHRVLHVLELFFGRNQTKLAAAVGCSQAAISRIVAGKQEPGTKVLAGVAAIPGIDAQWALHGIGRRPGPTQRAFQMEGLLPVLNDVASKMTAELQRTMSSEQRIVASPDFSPTRYFLRASEKSDLVADPIAKVMPGDLLLVEADASRWAGNPVYLDGRTCIVQDGIEGGRWRFVRARWAPDGAALRFDNLGSTASRRTRQVGKLPAKGISPADVVGVILQLLRPA